MKNRPNARFLPPAFCLAGILALVFRPLPLSAAVGDVLFSRPAIRADGTASAAVRSADGVWGILSAGPASAQAEFSPLRLEENFEELNLFSDARGRLWLAGTELRENSEMIRLGRLEKGSFAESRSIGLPGGWNGQPDLHFSEKTASWVAWHHQTDATDDIFVQNLVSGLRWRITTDGTSALSAPRLRPDGRGGLWALWTGRIDKNYVVAGRHFDGRAWSGQVIIAENGERPSLRLDADLGADGILRAVWSAYDGKNYRITTADCRSGFWSEPRRLRAGAGMEQNPRIVHFEGETAVVWAAESRGGTRLLAVFLDGDGTAAPFVVSEQADSPLFEAGATNEGLVLLRDDPVSPRFDFRKKASLRESGMIREKAGRGDDPALLHPAGLNQAVIRNENEYIGYGDSITYGMINEQEAPDKGYIPRLDARLDGVFGPTDVINEGRPGALTTGGLTHIDEVAAVHSGRYIFIMFGTNDVKITTDPIEVAIYNLGEICRRSLAAGVLPILSTVMPRRDWCWYYPKYRARHDTLNAGIRNLAPALVIPFVDMEKAFNTATGDAADLISDGVHPNEAGYIVMTDVWFAGVRGLPFPPLGLQARTKGGGSFSTSLLRPLGLQKGNNYVSVSPAVKYGVLLAWEANPKTADISSILGYRVYRKNQGESPEKFALIGTVSGFFAFLDRGVEEGDRFDYAVAAVGTGGIEGSRSDIAKNY